MHRRPSDARAETIYRVDHEVAPERTLEAAGDLFVSGLADVVARRPIELFAYTLHPDGYTLLVRATDDRLSAGLRDLQSGLARALNRREGVRGSLWAGRVRYRSMRHHAESVAALVDLLMAPVLRGAVEHPGDRGLPTSYRALVQRRPCGVPHTALPWYGTMDDAALARRLNAALDARLTAARAWSLAG